MNSNVDETRVPVLIGIGEVLDRPANDLDGLDAFELMLAALKAAEADAGVAVLDALDWLGVEDEISFPDPAPHERLAEHMVRDGGKRPPRLLKTHEASGDGPIKLINDAANLIGRGEISIAAAVGAEALRTAAKRYQAAIAAGQEPPKSSIADVAEANARPLARKHGLFTPIDVYPLYENAARAAWGQTLAEGQAESGRIGEGFAAVAAANPYAWIRKPASAEAIATATPDNRMVSFPYTKMMVANSSVNMGAAVIVASLAKARELGVDESRIVYIGAGAAAHEDEDFLLRDSYTHAVSLETTVLSALERNGLGASDIDHVELYSCFPIVPKLARRVLDWPQDKPCSVYGGLTFGGGPIGNCMMHAAARMVAKLREGGDHGLIVANGGYATHSHSMVFSRQPVAAGTFPQDYNVQPLADARRGTAPELLAEYSGPGTIETYTIPFDRYGSPRHATIIGRTPEGARFIARVPETDATTIAFLMADGTEPVGTAGQVITGPDGMAIWGPS
ncbi:acetyl-CoA acetyltransferase [Novosphingobium sp. AP12]|uniref:acetyl-CoA acetyltransferase n=1 Tax=Novosphingobium sp. AP12 TaxID=1144305 RepID=UPI000271F5AD|nr:acetyl-CoA acetyltransferase [Novosphingobium sp. AP12]EJL35180.1 acetyl-CoA acetyltransferase [Novosphingobium sp. AP12]